MDSGSGCKETSGSELCWMDVACVRKERSRKRWNDATSPNRNPRRLSSSHQGHLLDLQRPHRITATVRAPAHPGPTRPLDRRLLKLTPNQRPWVYLHDLRRAPSPFTATTTATMPRSIELNPSAPHCHPTSLHRVAVPSRLSMPRRTFPTCPLSAEIDMWIYVILGHPAETGLGLGLARVLVHTRPTARLALRSTRTRKARMIATIAPADVGGGPRRPAGRVMWAQVRRTRRRWRGSKRHWETMVKPTFSSTKRSSRSRTPVWPSISEITFGLFIRIR